MMRNFVFTSSRLAALCLLLLPAGVPTAAASPKVPVIAKWGRFEQSFKSSVAYSNAVQDASLAVLFTSPLGDTSRVDGFWDGGKTWRVRFAPDQPGRWKFKTTCSDTANFGLHNQTGEFLCTAATGPTRFHKHGPVRVARDHRHLEHADGTPFFWLADTVWSGARAAEPKDWDFYAQTRAYQRFTVAQWAVAPGDDAKKQSAYIGFPDRIAINPDFFKRLDAKLDTLSQAGILSAIAPLWRCHRKRSPPWRCPTTRPSCSFAMSSPAGAPSRSPGCSPSRATARPKTPARWKRIGQAVFGSRTHAPVVLFPGETQWLLDEFRDRAVG